MGKTIKDLASGDSLGWVATLLVILVVVLAVLYFAKKRKNRGPSTSPVTGGGLGAAVGHILSLGGGADVDSAEPRGIMASVVVAEPAGSDSD